MEITTSIIIKIFIPYINGASERIANAKNSYIGQTKRNIYTTLTDQIRSTKYQLIGKSSLSEHSFITKHNMTDIAKTKVWQNRTVWKNNL